MFGIKNLFKKDYIPKFSGLLPDLPDDRDIPLSSIQVPVEIPEEFERDISQIPIDSQGQHPACTGYAAQKLRKVKNCINTIVLLIYHQGLFMLWLRKLMGMMAREVI